MGAALDAPPVVDGRPLQPATAGAAAELVAATLRVMSSLRSLPILGIVLWLQIGIPDSLARLLEDQHNFDIC